MRYAILAALGLGLLAGCESGMFDGVEAEPLIGAGAGAAVGSAIGDTPGAVVGGVGGYLGGEALADEDIFD